MLLCCCGIITFLQAQNVSYGGKVTLFDGTTTLAGVIVAFDVNNGEVKSCTTDVSGNYTVSIDTGNYRSIRVRNLEKRIPGIPFTVEYTAKNSFRVTSATNEDLRMCRFFQIHGKVLTESGDTVKGAYIESGKDMGYGPPRDRDSSGLSSGNYSILSDSGNCRVTVHPPSGSGLKETYFDIHVSKDTLFNLVLPAVITVSGILTNYENDTLKQIGITFERTGRQIDSFTNSSGKYSITMNKGTYAIRIRNGMMYSVKGAPAHLEEYVARDLSLMKDTTINIKLPHYPVVRCSVITSEGTPIQNVIVKTSEGPTAAVPLGDIDTTNVSGICVLRVRGAVKNNLWITPPLQTSLGERTDSLRVNSDTTLIIRLTQGIILSGKIFYSDSLNPVSNLGVAIEQGAEQKMVYTNVSGNYSIQLQPGTYRFRLRNTYSMSGYAAGVPQNLEYTVKESLVLTKSETLNVRLPYFPTISGTVKNSAGAVLSNVGLRFTRWEGSEMPPYVETATNMSGEFSVVIGGGVNRVKVTAPPGNLYSSFVFIESFDTSGVKNIYLPDQARGITRIVPSVITRGETGKIMINGLNAQLDAVGSISDINLGVGITIDSIKKVSPITLFAYIKIDSAAVTGARDIIVHAGTVNSLGAKLLTITAPASAGLNLDANGKTTKEIVISDGTGTELTIPMGTSITLPQGAAQVISYEAPIVKDDTTDPAGADFANVQRTLEPHGLSFGDTVIMTCQYTNSDVEGMNESSLTPFYFTDSSSGNGAVGSSIAIVERDTAANQISMILPHFSMFRLAAVKATTGISTSGTVSADVKKFTMVKTGKQQMLTFHVSTRDANSNVNISLYNLKGVLVKKYLHCVLSEGIYTVVINSSDFQNSLSTNQYILSIVIGKKLYSKTVMLGL
jgi:hypothetical protein